jgi:hypothetical protein
MRDAPRPLFVAALFAVTATLLLACTSMPSTPASHTTAVPSRTSDVPTQSATASVPAPPALTPPFVPGPPQAADRCRDGTEAGQPQQPAAQAPVFRRLEALSCALLAAVDLPAGFQTLPEQRLADGPGSAWLPAPTRLESAPPGVLAVSAGDLVSGTAFVRRRFAAAGGARPDAAGSDLTVVLLAYPTVSAAQTGLLDVEHQPPPLAAGRSWQLLTPNVPGTTGIPGIEEGTSLSAIGPAGTNADRTALICWRQGRVVAVLLRTGPVPDVDDATWQALVRRQVSLVAAAQRTSTVL